MVRTLDCCIAVGLVIMIGAMAWRYQEDETRRRVDMNAQSRAFFPTAPSWCYPASGWQPSTPDDRLWHLEKCYPDIERLAPPKSR